MSRRRVNRFSPETPAAGNRIPARKTATTPAVTRAGTRAGIPETTPARTRGRPRQPRHDSAGTDRHSWIRGPCVRRAHPGPWSARGPTDQIKGLSGLSGSVKFGAPTL